MKIVFEMADVDYENKDFLLQALDFEKAFFFNDIMENCVPLSKVLDDIKIEIEQEYKVESEHPYGQGLRRAIEIIDKYIAEGSDKE